MSLIPPADFTSTAMDDLRRVSRSAVAEGGSSAGWEWVRYGTARSIRRTEAPLSARRRPAKGAERC